MNDQAETARDDLAFMRGVVESGGRGSMAAGSVFLAAGLIYGSLCFVRWASASGFISLPAGAGGIGATVLFLVILGIAGRRMRRTTQGSSARAVNAAFGTAGLTVIVMLAVAAIVSWKLHQPAILRIYPIMVFALMGAAWLIAAQIRRRFWPLAVGLGWYAAAIAMALLFGTTSYLLAAGVSLLLLMALPGAVMLSLSRRAAEG